jgi:hypothetical protein
LKAVKQTLPEKIMILTMKIHDTAKVFGRIGILVRCRYGEVTDVQQTKNN